MTTYEALMLMLTFGSLVIAIVRNNDRKKIAPCSQQGDYTVV